MTTLLVSDIHLGSPSSRARALLALLKEETFSRLILLGDIFADQNIGRLKEDHFKLLSYLNQLSNPDRAVEVVWVIGNHDEGVVGVLAGLVGVDALSEYCWEWQGKRCIAVHGHQFDVVVMRGPRLSRFFSYLFLELQKIHWFRRHLSVIVDQVSAQWQRMTPKVARYALAFARMREASIIFCGHTHEPHQQQRDGVLYYNTGCWVANLCSYIRITDDAIEQLHRMVLVET